MKRPRNFTSLFVTERAPAGCARGDDALWSRMRELSINEPWPGALSEIRPRVLRYFEEIVGQPAIGCETIYAPHLGTYGISGGIVKPEYWRDNAIPWLEASFIKMTKG
jgi:hypothetical protein